jgi:hypothetical protein
MGIIASFRLTAMSALEGTVWYTSHRKPQKNKDKCGTSWVLLALGRGPSGYLVDGRL